MLLGCSPTFSLCRHGLCVQVVAVQPHTGHIGQDTSAKRCMRPGPIPELWPLERPSGPNWPSSGLISHSSSRVTLRASKQWRIGQSTASSPSMTGPVLDGVIGTCCYLLLRAIPKINVCWLCWLSILPWRPGKERRQASQHCHNAYFLINSLSVPYGFLDRIP